MEQEGMGFPDFFDVSDIPDVEAIERRKKLVYCKIGPPDVTLSCIYRTLPFLINVVSK